jgi:hypothetical protein
VKCTQPIKMWISLPFYDNAWCVTGELHRLRGIVFLFLHICRRLHCEHHRHTVEQFLYEHEGQQWISQEPATAETGERHGLHKCSE